MSIQDKKNANISAWSRNLRRWASVFEGENEGPWFLGSDALWSALWAKDLIALGEVLKTYPEIIAQEFVCRGTNGHELRSGRLSRMIVNLGWTDALDVLWQVGDRFDLPDKKKNTLRNQRSYCVLEHAIFEGRIAALNRMIKLGVDPNGKPPAPPSMEILLCGSYQRNSDKDVSAVLAKAGVDPWRKIPTHPNDPIIVALLAGNRSHAALSLLSYMKAVPSVEDGEKLVSAWSSGIRRAFANNAFEDSIEILKHFHRLGCPPPKLESLLEIGTVPAMDLFDGSADTHTEIMEFICRNDYCEMEDWDCVSKILKRVSYSGSDLWKTKLAHIHLNKASIPASSQQRRPHHRL